MRLESNIFFGAERLEKSMKHMDKGFLKLNVGSHPVIVDNYHI